MQITYLIYFWIANSIQAQLHSNCCPENRCSPYGYSASHCPYGCVYGYWDDQCQSLCVDNCQKCYRYSGHCIDCIDGYYLYYRYINSIGNYYCKQCSVNCLSCTDRENCNSCKAGYYGAQCHERCLQNCKSCNDRNTCLECMDGYRDEDCSANCSEGCVNKLCSQTDAVCTGECKEGYFGKHCCLPGIFGWSCELQCPTHCNTCTSLTGCQSCKNGFYGSTCNERCPVNCKTCISQMNCTECTNGYTGTTCQIQCPENCLACNNVGKCVTCKDGFSRPDTECQCLNTLCTPPKCTSSTNSTYYANSSTCCPCNINCKHDTCISADQCTDGCKDGMFGPKCELPCTQIDMKCSVCSGNNLQSSVCKTCTYGYYPPTNRTCVQCSTLCVDGKCNSSNGHCVKGCQDGFWNPKCDRNCSEKCKLCNQDSGDCLICSLTGVFGAKCDMPCSNTCLNESCHMNGTCKSGCIPDFYGPSCEQSCPTNCANGSNGTRCSRAIGLCLYGCNEGFVGEGCVEALKLDKTKDTLPAAAIGGGVAAVAVVAIMVVVGIFVRQRNRMPLYDNVERETHEDRAEHAYDGLHMNLSAGTKECSTTVVRTHTDYQNTSDRFSESTEQTANEEHTYEIGF